VLYVGGAGNSTIAIKRINSAANNFTVGTTGTTSAQIINGATTKTRGAQYAAITAQRAGANWFAV
jgi:hypothetical protein